MTIEGATTAEVFDAFVEHFLVPDLKPGDVVVLDKVGAHKPVYIRQRIEAAGAFVLLKAATHVRVRSDSFEWQYASGALQW
jgi:hypothetical protein